MHHSKMSRIAHLQVFITVIFYLCSNQAHDCSHVLALSVKKSLLLRSAVLHPSATSSIGSGKILAGLRNIKHCAKSAPTVHFSRQRVRNLQIQKPIGRSNGTSPNYTTRNFSIESGNVKSSGISPCEVSLATRAVKKAASTVLPISMSPPIMSARFLKTLFTPKYFFIMIVQTLIGTAMGQTDIVADIHNPNVSWTEAVRNMWSNLNENKDKTLTVLAMITPWNIAQVVIFAALDARFPGFKDVMVKSVYTAAREAYKAGYATSLAKFVTSPSIQSVRLQFSEWVKKLAASVLSVQVTYSVYWAQMSTTTGLWADFETDTYNKGAAEVFFNFGRTFAGTMKEIIFGIAPTQFYDEESKEWADLSIEEKIKEEARVNALRNKTWKVTADTVLIGTSGAILQFSIIPLFLRKYWVAGFSIWWNYYMASKHLGGEHGMEDKNSLADDHMDTKKTCVDSDKIEEMIGLQILTTAVHADDVADCESVDCQHEHDETLEFDSFLPTIGGSVSVKQSIGQAIIEGTKSLMMSSPVEPILADLPPAFRAIFDKVGIMKSPMEHLAPPKIKSESVQVIDIISSVRPDNSLVIWNDFFSFVVQDSGDQDREHFKDVRNKMKEVIECFGKGGGWY